MVVATAAMMSALLASPAEAQEGNEEPSRLQPLKVCQMQSDPAARLACYDSAVEDIVSAESQGELRIVDQEEVRATRRKLFGFSLPDLGIFGDPDGGSDGDDLDEIETTIKSVSGSHSSGYLIRTADDAVWRIDSVPRRLLNPEVGDTLLIKGAALSSYFLRINGQGGVKGVRVR
ncbi:MAG: hypothetical protein DI637_03335 [Citromicrobium sp.]|nr:MAG: hypothetical protein DI637_03335 [Citromicrobium sp.]